MTLLLYGSRVRLLPGVEINFYMKKSSIRNQLAGKVQQITRGPVVSEVVVSTAAGTLASVITTRSVRDLNLKKGDAVFVMVKATEAFIQKDKA